MFGAGMIPTHDIEGAISEARRAVNELGFKTVFVRPNPATAATGMTPTTIRSGPSSNDWACHSAACVHWRLLV